MEIDVVTLFPRIVEGPLEESILKRARERGLVAIRVHNLRDFAHDKHRVVDDKPFGGGPGMVLKPEPIFEAVETLRRPESRVVLMCPQGRRLTQAVARELAQLPHLLILCGHYEGVDERVREALVQDEISIGDYVLTNGALAAAVLIDAVVRLLPGALGDETSATSDSFTNGLLEGPQYTRPAEFRGMRVPEVLLSGNHEEIARWRREQALRRTAQRRPDLLEGRQT
ncbi:MAG: tRNA (guanosine(37)-N1)-methyltransferase TrmD [Verrucomicrobiae bacterium]|nr:tRNA (guanosine(37)-N1)-methyltransferase TrmD [Verrucomicrobiae bacterium]MDW8343420.1 tRNA (guanosine(37)-N1)-methyltransferase TrmD [Verrucomicrobiae bacterium]